MTDFASLLLPDRGQPARTIRLVATIGFDAWLSSLPEDRRALVRAAGFEAKADSYVIVPTEGGAWEAVAGIGETAGPWDLAATTAKLPEGNYRLASDGHGDGGHGGRRPATAPGQAALGWLLAQHRFDRYRQRPEPPCPRVLLTPDPANIDAMVRLATATALVRDLVDTPADDLGPAELAAAASAVARAHRASFTVTHGDALAEGYPMIHAVGRAAARGRGPRLIELEWGDPTHPRIALVGKGVCFDSGGLDIKPSSGMLLMKKDMGGAAHALALAGLVMGGGLPVRLHLLIPAVENAISSEAFRPGDILRSRKGPRVEIGNTDAEGRLVLADALTRACEQMPALLIDFATLTGAARVALGPDIPALFTNDDTLAAELGAAASAAADPVWRLPLWQPYHDMLKSDVADINNAGSGGFAGAVTAALFLEKFVEPGIPWIHLDTFSWRPNARPGRPKGGDALGLRAVWEMLGRRFRDIVPARAIP